MRLYTLLKDVTIEKTNIADFSAAVTGLTDQSGKVAQGMVFVCVPGIRHDGHDYIERAVLCGAAVIVAERMTDALKEGGIPYVITPSARKALALMWSAYYEYPHRQMKMFAVTGTNGKSSTCAILRSILEKAGYPTGIIGSISNEFAGVRLEGDCMTTPDPEKLFSLLHRMKDMGAKAVVMEASSHALALDKLYGVTFDIGVFTNLSPEHLDFHPTMEDYAAAKAKLFRMCKTGLVNDDDRYKEAVTRGAVCEIRTFSIQKTADYAAKEIEYLGQAGIHYMFLARSELFRIDSPLIGRFSVYNTLAAAAAAYEAGVSSFDIHDGIAAVTGIAGRAEKIATPKGYSVVIDYAHTPAALENIITELNKLKTGRLITVFGCGGDRDKSKRPLMGRTAASLSDLAVVTTDNPRNEDPDAIISDILSGIDGGQITIIRDRKKAIEYALQIARENDIVLIAGKGHEDYQILSDGIHPFSEKDIIKRMIES